MKKKTILSMMLIFSILLNYFSLIVSSDSEEYTNNNKAKIISEDIGAEMSKISIKLSDAIDYDELGYCFDWGKTYPTTDRENPDEYDISNLEISTIGSIDKNKINQIKNIIYYGYPNDKGNVGKENNLDTHPAIFYAITQICIWETLGQLTAEELNNKLENIKSDNDDIDVVNIYNQLKEKRDYPASENILLYLYEPTSDVNQRILSAILRNPEPPTPIEPKKNIIISKQKMSDSNTSFVNVVGAVIQIFEGENTSGKKIAEWETNGEDKIIENLSVEKKYTFHEESAPSGLKVVSDFIFSVNKDGFITLDKVDTNGNVKFQDNKLIVIDDKDEPISTTKVSVEKVWLDDEGKVLTENKIPVESIKAVLYKDGVKTDKSLVLNKTNGWKATFDNLPASDNSNLEKKYVYTVKEEGETNNKISLNNKQYIVSYSGDQAKGFTITNKVPKPLTPLVPSTTKVSVEKVWLDDEGKVLTENKIPVESIKAVLYKDGVKTDKSLVLNKTNGWKATFDNLPTSDSSNLEKKYVYTVKEEGETNNKISLNNKQYVVSYSGDQSKGFTITNKVPKPLTPLVPSTTKVSVEKVWLDDEGKVLTENKIPVESIKAVLYKDGVKTDKSLVLNKTNGWKATFDNLPASDNSNLEKKYVYTVKEEGETNNKISLNKKQYIVSYSGDQAKGFTITNKTPKPSTTPSKPKPSKITDPTTSKNEKLTKPTGGTKLPVTGERQDPFLYSIIVGTVGIALILLGSWRKKIERKQNL